jgi:hypothetical protein
MLSEDFFSSGALQIAWDAPEGSISFGSNEGSPVYMVEANDFLPENSLEMFDDIHEAWNAAENSIHFSSEQEGEVYHTR